MHHPPPFFHLRLAAPEMIDGCLSLLVCACIVGRFFALLLFANVLILARNLDLFPSLILSTYTQVYYSSILYCVIPLSR